MSRYRKPQLGMSGTSSNPPPSLLPFFHCFPRRLATLSLQPPPTPVPSPLPPLSFANREQRMKKPSSYPISLVLLKAPSRVAPAFHPPPYAVRRRARASVCQCIFPLLFVDLGPSHPRQAFRRYAQR
ncbi:hypothetical protein GQ53DRAFT_227844 [Thozetella sp. PMI_491]|nr:hypothetical protein GQ53DRAFT_227844 [Thozetella sp. PMI_491]